MTSDIDWDTIVVRLCRATGWDWDTVEDQMTMERLDAFSRSFVVVPPEYEVTTFVAIAHGMKIDSTKTAPTKTAPTMPRDDPSVRIGDSIVASLDAARARRRERGEAEGSPSVAAMFPDGSVRL